MAEESYWNEDRALVPPPTVSNKLRSFFTDLSANTKCLYDNYNDLIAPGMVVQRFPLTDGEIVPSLKAGQSGLMQLIIDQRITDKPGFTNPYAHRKGIVPEDFDALADLMESDDIYVGPSAATRISAVAGRLLVRSVMYVRGSTKPNTEHTGVYASTLGKSSMLGLRPGIALGTLVVGRTETTNHSLFMSDTKVTHATKIMYA